MVLHETCLHRRKQRAFKSCNIQTWWMGGGHQTEQRL